VNRKDITLAKQLEQRKNWKDALVDAVVATFLVRKKQKEHMSVLADWEFLVTERVKGAEKGQLQAHHGGFMKVTDRDIYAGAVREVKEETGYVLDADSDIFYLTSVGPELFRSEMSLYKNEMVLHVNEEEAEPAVGFALPLFIADVTGKKPEVKTDGEVRDPNWMTAEQIVTRFGRRWSQEPHSKFNYFQMLVPAILFLDGRWQPGQRSVSEPGRHVFKIK